MTQEQWTAVDGYVQDLFIPRRSHTGSRVTGEHRGRATGDQRFATSRQAAAAARTNARSSDHPRNWHPRWLQHDLACAGLLADGRLVTLEVNPRYAEIARTNIARVGLTNIVDVRLGRALETLPQIAAENGGPFDLTFIDADKESTPEDFAWALRLSRPGSVIIVDNVVRNGAIVDADSADPRVQGIRRFNELLAAETRVSATTIQTVGSKGYDGFALALAL